MTTILHVYIYDIQQYYWCPPPYQKNADNLWTWAESNRQYSNANATLYHLTTGPFCPPGGN